MNFLVSKVVGVTLDVILILAFGGFLFFNIYKLVLRIKEKKAKKKKLDDELNRKDN